MLQDFQCLLSPNCFQIYAMHSKTTISNFVHIPIEKKIDGKRGKENQRFVKICHF